MMILRADFWTLGYPITTDKIRFKTLEIQERQLMEDKVLTGMLQMMDEPLTEAIKPKIEFKVRDCRAKLGLLQKSLTKYKGLMLDSPGSEGDGISLNYSKILHAI